MLSTITVALCAVLSALIAWMVVGRLRSAETSVAGNEKGDSQSHISPTRTLFILAALVAALLTLNVVSTIWTDARSGDKNELSDVQEFTQSPAWKRWRAQVHREITAQPVTPQSLAKVFRIPRPELKSPFSEASALRRDQAIADVFMSYEKVSDLLYDRFGINREFLGTGLSRPLGASPYASASVHEYLVDNHPDTHDHVWYWEFPAASIISSQNSVSHDPTFSRPIHAIIAGEKDRVRPVNHHKETHDFEEDLKVIRLRVENQDHPLPPMIRFARLNKEKYSHKLGRPNATHVFTSNLSEVWNLTFQQAAEKSGYIYKREDDTFFIWIFVPYHSSEFTPANWGAIFNRLPEWLDRE